MSDSEAPDRSKGATEAAALVLADHQLAEVLDRAGLLAVRAVAAPDPMPLCPKCGKAVTLWTDLNHAARADCDACGYSTFDAARDI